MRELKFYKLSLLLPLILSAACVPFLFLNVRLPEWIGNAIGITAWSGLVAGIPYVIFALALLLWARGRTERQFRHALILSPILLLPVFSVYIFIIALFIDRQSIGWQTLIGLYFYVPWILGYGYVALVLSITFFFRRLRLISPSTAT
jgi:hypothetical protein